MRHVLCVLAVVLASGISQARAELLHVSVLFEKGDSLLPSGELQIGEEGVISVFVENLNEDPVQLSGFTLELLIEGVGTTSGTGRQLWFDNPQIAPSSDPDYVFFGDSSGQLFGPYDPEVEPIQDTLELWVDDLVGSDNSAVIPPYESRLLTRLKIISASGGYQPIPGDVFQIGLDDGTVFYDLPLDPDLEAVIYDFTFTPATITAVPEPSSLVLLTGMGLSMLVWHRRRRGCR